VYNQYRLKQKAFKELEKADQIIREQKNELEIMNKTRDRFFSIISHDLKNSFTSLQMGTKLLSNIEELDKDEIKLVSKELAESVENLYKLLENLLEWARIQIGRIHHEPEELDISEVLEDVLKVMDSKAAQKNIRLTTEIIENTKVFADKNMLYSVLQNLISNAIKFTEQTGEIRIQQTEKENKLEMSICDNGVGMSAIQLSKIFRIDEIISTPGTDDEKGTGLGLILCKEFIDKNGGEIRVESELGKGTEVCFNLPLK
nr:HAMP domain-containing histidine kinase [Candidatus Cloacimonadota bacterium]